MRRLLLLLSALVLAVVGAAAVPGSAQAATGSTYKITVNTGVGFTPGTSDIGLHCADCGTTITPPFPLTAYGSTYSTIYVSMKGNVQFGGPGTFAWNNDCLPSSTFSRPTVLAFWDDLRGDAAGDGVFSRTVGSAPYRQYILEWRAHAYDDASQAANFSITFQESSGRINLTYGDVTNEGGGATIGAQSGNQATQYSCNGSDAVSSGLRVNLVPVKAQPATSYRIDTGSSTNYTDSDGNVWLRDQFYAGGNTDTRQNRPISGTVDDPIYQSERYGMSGYHFPIKNGSYRVELHFAETSPCCSSPGDRVFAISLEGKTVFPRFDILTKVSKYTAAIIYKNATVSDGQLDIGFRAIVNNPTIEGIVISPLQ